MNRPDPRLRSASTSSRRLQDRTTGVLIVGAGPTGLLLAAELERRKVPCHLIDARPSPLHWDRATVIHPRSLEVFAAIGLIDEFLDAGCRQRIIVLHSAGRVLGTMDLSDCGSLYGFNLGLSEEVTESILQRHLQRLGGRVHRSSRLVGLHRNADEVSTDIETDDGRYTLHARWIVGCDGLHSATRRLSGISFNGDEITRPWAVFDARLRNWVHTFEGNFVYLDSTPVILTALPRQRWRVYMRPSTPDSDLVAEAAASLRRYEPEIEFVDVEHPTRFTCHTKIAASYRSDSVFLAGDAAHVCSPAEGHGMNCGLQDAFNLAWKLALVYHGDARAELLNSYESERRPVAERVMRSGDLAEALQKPKDQLAREQRDAAIAGLLADPTTRHHEIAAEAELNIDYADSPIVVADAGKRFDAGSRFPTMHRVHTQNGTSCGLHELTYRSGHTLILVGGVASDESAFQALAGALKELTEENRVLESLLCLAEGKDLPGTHGKIERDSRASLEVNDTTLFIVRPDGHIGLRADRAHLAMASRYLEVIRRGGPSGS